ncbi:hypothetical protein [Agromyces larvae]|uniref:Uncharacterized protein n=1 Tax=Agromyces larvae TaxID=2929802 RepID=A0ABY4C1J7_9MICO|nr:hypothetical protein [Agromyces larvae]UOE45285.1 hypothetical protein MTO99_05840 [Agromyces larvae]
MNPWEPMSAEHLYSNPRLEDRVSKLEEATKRGLRANAAAADELADRLDSVSARQARSDARRHEAIMKQVANVLGPRQPDTVIVTEGRHRPLVIFPGDKVSWRSVI